MNRERIQQLYQRLSECTQRQQWDEARTICEAILQQAPQEAIAWYCLGELDFFREHPAAAVAALARAIALDPHNLSYLRTYCLALHNARHWNESLTASRRYLQHKNDDPQLWMIYGFAAALQGHLQQAQSAYDASLVLEPTGASTMLAHAQELSTLGNKAASLALMQALTTRCPAAIDPWIALAELCLQLERWSEALAACERCLHLDPTRLQPRYFRLVALMRQWLLPEAEAEVRQLLAEHPREGEAWAVLGALLNMQGRANEAVSPLRQAVAIGRHSTRHSLLLLTHQYLEGQTAASLLAVHREWSAAYTPASLAGGPLRRELPSQRPLRIGIVSADLGVQATSYLVLPCLEALDKSHCFLSIYSDRDSKDDAVTSRFKSAADTWRDTYGWNSTRLQEQIRADQIDVLIDLMGHTGARLDLFASRAAPLQLTWAGYVGTTGIPAIDYILADRHHIPPGEESAYVEKVLRLPHGYICYSPLAATPDPSPLPAHASGVVTFGCFNTPCKYTATTLDTWAAILRQVPSSRLLLKYGGLQHPQLQARLRTRFAEQGIQPDRLLFQGWTPAHEIFAHYHHVDIALDTFPYSGGVTTCEALWMGVPVVTFPGQTFASRHSTSHLSTAGLPQFIARDVPGYIALAVEWSQRLPELAQLRSTLRSQLQQSPLASADQFARDFLTTLRTAFLS